MGKDQLKASQVRPFFVCLLFAICFLLRLYQLGYHDLWFDEVASAGYAQHPWGNWNAPFYWIFLHGWVKFFGFSEFVLRFPSLIFSLSSVVFLFFLGKELFNARVGFCAALFMGLSPFHLWYAQEARDYTMVLCLGVCASLLLAKALKQDRSIFWISFALVSMIGLYTNYFYAVLLMAQGGVVLAFKRHQIKFLEVLSFLIPVLAFSYYLPHFFEKFIYIAHGFWVPRPSPASLLITLENFLLGYNGWPALYLVADIVIGILFVAACWNAYRQKLYQNFLVCLVLFLIPIGCIFIFSINFFSIYLDRAFLIFTPFFYLVLSVGLGYASRWFRFLAVAVLAGLMLTSVAAFFKNHMVMPFEHHVGVWLKKPIKPVGVFLKAHLASDDALAFTNNSILRSLYFYHHQGLPLYYYLFDPRFPETDWQRPIQESPRCIPYYKASGLKFNKLWVVFSDWPRDKTLGPSSQSTKDWLDKNMVQEFSREFDGLMVVRYARP